MSLCVQVDVPLSGDEVLRLLGCERRLSLDGIFRGAAFLGEPDLRCGTLALGCGSVEVRHGHRSGETDISDGPGDYSRRRIISEVSHCLASTLHRRYLLGAH